VFERRANYSAAHDARGPEQDTTACFPRCICCAVSALYRAGLCDGLRGGCEEAGRDVAVLEFEQDWPVVRGSKYCQSAV